MDVNNNLKWVVGWFLPVNDLNNQLCEEWRLNEKRHYEGQSDHLVWEYKYVQWFESLEMAKATLANVTKLYYDSQPTQYRTHKPYLSRDYAI